MVSLIFNLVSIIFSLFKIGPHTYKCLQNSPYHQLLLRCPTLAWNGQNTPYKTGNPPFLGWFLELS